MFCIIHFGNPKNDKFLGSSTLYSQKLKTNNIKILCLQVFYYNIYESTNNNNNNKNKNKTLLLNNIRTYSTLSKGALSTTTTATTKKMSMDDSFELPTNLNHFLSYVPSLEYHMHKGQCGRIGVFGGSAEYTGAPFFAGITSLRLGADIVHIFAPSEGGTATAIKTLSPELIVHPLDQQMDPSTIIPWLLSIHVLIIGPGLGRSSIAWKSAKEVIKAARNINLPMVLDGDALRLICEDLELVKGYDKVILTPNFVEYRALSDAAKKLNNDNSNNILSPSDLAKALGNVVIVQKGQEDIITDGTISYSCDKAGMPRRCGGQGDVLAGVIGTFYAWTQNALKGKTSEELEHLKESIGENQSAAASAAYAGCVLVRYAAKLAFKNNRRSTITDDIIKSVPNALVWGFLTDDRGRPTI
ncbi:carbohydrate kinase-like protein [Heterostelium album PN500]|uniref:ATP-dependent (S)-NAD(P)H-hydrate dehydratase n=1 Tax=Heterostelium pallidum (strain ATCC 26659 / Pp 5 / PN500) TaxID=670386 RepID=NNRD_HETP5|nr:carbohydrate kinase-like protein [Heterostelium album PN500]D3BMU4.1 RecName: Full=ATP-dependent (S)-NAD(P)H-hydrate dehydratase; AltName: Full=ATP-dependent NAD(P)HX dehydratase [Heterostelium album PN500]EFA77306.1 carbohydrate kinase-like protein [Heterostelium album PN500]|eukprot:XP_020429435.1 carbohydrate kinase-like protein [Heterostelium album PN500]